MKGVIFLKPGWLNYTDVTHHQYPCKGSEVFHQVQQCACNQSHKLQTKMECMKDKKEHKCHRNVFLMRVQCLWMKLCFVRRHNTDCVHWLWLYTTMFHIQCFTVNACFCPIFILITDVPVALTLWTPGCFFSLFTPFIYRCMTYSLHVSDRGNIWGNSDIVISITTLWKILYLFSGWVLLKQYTQFQIILCLFYFLVCALKDFQHTANNCIWMNRVFQRYTLCILGILRLSIVKKCNDSVVLYFFLTFRLIIIINFIFQKLRSASHDKIK